MVYFCICSRNIDYAAKLKQIVTNYCDSIPETFAIDCFYDPEVFLSFSGKHCVYILDIDDIETNIQSIIDNIQKKSKYAVILFLSEKPEHAITSYQYGAIDFIQKPLNEEKLKETFKRVQKKIEKDLCLLKTIDGPTRIEVKQIKYIDIQNRSICYHLLEQEIYGLCVRKAFKDELKKLLERHPEFILISNGLAVNIDNIKRINKKEIEFHDQDIILLNKSMYNRVYPIWDSFNEERGY